MTQPEASPPQGRQAVPGEHTILIHYRPSPRGCGAFYTRIEATEGLAASIQYANDPVREALPTPAIGHVTHSFADLWPGDEVELLTGPFRMVIRLSDPATLRDSLQPRDRKLSEGKS